MGNVREECSGEMWSEVSLTVKTARQREFSVAQTGKRNEMVPRPPLS